MGWGLGLGFAQRSVSVTVTFCYYGDIVNMDFAEMKEGIFRLLLKLTIRTALVLSVFLVSASARGEIIPTDRRITWQGNVGIPGGITNRSTIFANVKNAPYNAKGDGTNDDTAAIQAALNACPREQVVYLPAGTYKVTSPLVLKNSYTMRGVGSTTVINYVGSSPYYGAGIISFGTAAGWTTIQNTSGTAITSVANKGTNQVVVGSASGFSVGQYMEVDCLDDGTVVADNGVEGSCTCCSRASRHLSQIVEVTAISGNTITFNPPLYTTYSNALSPQAVVFNVTLKYAGVENLHVKANNTGMDLNFQMYDVAYCWIKGCESDYTDGDHAWVAECYRCELRDNWFHDGYVHGPGSHDDTIIIMCHSSGILYEDNIMTRLHCGVMLEGGGGGHVIGYNFVTNTFDSGSYTAIMPDLNYHGLYVQQTLWEGNSASSLSQDSIHGPSGTGTALRNYLAGNNWNNGSGSWIQGGYGFRPVNLGHTSYQFNLVGNILGKDMPLNNSGYNAVYMRSWPSVRSYDEPNIFSLGYGYGADNGDNSGGVSSINDDTMPFFSLINHGNWDSVTGTIQWSNSIPDRTIPSSYYLSSAPSWFGNMTWPPFNPTNSPASAPVIPAQYRYLYGTNPPAGVINQPPVAQASGTPTNGPAPLAVSFSSAGSYDPEGATLTYSWTFGDGGTSTTANPSHTYANAGTYSAQLSVSDGTNTTSAAPITIRATIPGSNQPPVAVANVIPASGPAPLAVTFSSAGSYDPEGATLTYNWTFGDGATSTAANPSHTYAAGTFSARLQVSDGTNNTTSSPLTITVTNPPPAVLLTSPTNGASYSAPATINLAATVTANGHTITKVQFLSNGTSLLGEATTAPYTLSWTNVGAGSYTITARVVYDAGATSDSPTVTVSVGGLVAAYGFEEGSGATTVDVSGNGNVGTISGATWTGTGKYGNALSFNGTSSLVTVNDSTSLDLTTGLTLEAWVYPTAVGGWKSILLKPQGTTGLCYALQGSSAAAGVPSLGLSVSASNLMAPNPLPLNTWSHLAATYDGSTMVLYVNGVQVASQAQTGTLSTSTDALTIGGDVAGEDWAGSIDEVRIYNRALSASEIQGDMYTPVHSRPLPPPNFRRVGP